MAIQDFNLVSLDGRNGFRVVSEGFNWLGYSVSDAGDVNGDGFDDVIIGAPLSGINRGEEGASYVIFGNASGFDVQIDLSSLDGSNGFRLDGEEIFDSVGSSVSDAGDVNGDGFDDVIAGATGVDHNGERSGSSYVVFGKASGFDAQMDLSSLDGRNGFRLDGAMAEDKSGFSVSSAGDMNGDGFDDVIVGAPRLGYRDSSDSSYVVFGRAAGFDARMDLSSLDGNNGFRFTEGAAGENLGLSVSSAGDVNGDGFDDVIVSARNYGFTDYSGSCYVVFGRASGFDAQMDLSSLDGNNGFRFTVGAAGETLGLSVSSAGDVNGDGFDDVIVGALNFGFNDGSDGDYSGSCYVVFGRASGFDAQMDLSSLDGSNGFRLVSSDFDKLGYSVSAAGDVNGDGLDDVIIGAPYSSSYLTQAGSSYVVFGRASGFEAQIDLSNLDVRDGFRLNGENSNNRLGHSVSGAGDVNHDGFADLIVSSMSVNAEAGYVIFGGPDVTGNLALTRIEGTADADHLQGSTTVEYLTAGAGDDTLAGGGGADKFDGGEGDDVFSLNDLGFALIDGGAGNDTLSLAGSGMFLDLTQRAGDIHHVEIIDLQGAGDNTLKLDTNSIRNKNSFEAGSLTVQGNKGDRVAISDMDWTDEGVADGYHDYASPHGTLHVQSSVQVDFVHDVRRVFDVANLDGSNGFRLNGENIDDVAGNSVSNAGDINGDGLDDLIVGAPGAYSSYVVFGKTSGFDVDMNLSDLDGSDGFRLNGAGGSVSGAGDVNGDGLDDVIIGAGNASYVMFGKSSAFDAQIDLSSLDGSDGFRFDESGDSVSGVGDVNGDGLGDVIISEGNSSYVVFGKTSEFDASMDLSGVDGSNGFRLIGAQADDLLGDFVNDAGDVNGDGFDDVIIGAQNTDPSGDHSGSSYVIFGKASGFSATMNLASLDGSNGFRLDGENERDFLGRSVSGAGDVNGDGFDDVVIGAPLTDSRASDSGSTYVVFGKASGFDAQLDLSDLDGSNGFRLDGERETDGLGLSVSGAGDFNGDGYDDLIIGTHHYNEFRYSSLAFSYVVFGKASGFDAQLNLGDLPFDEGFRLEGGYTLTFGSVVSGAGDVNGDGLDDLIIGAPESAIGSAYYTAGKSYVIFGDRNFGSGVGGNGDLPEIKGTDGDDTLKGSDIAEHFIAGDGNDNLLGRGGADVFDAEAGNDAIRIGDLTFASVDGGDGNDALHLAGANLNLDLTALGSNIHSIETICLYGRGDNTLTLNADSLLNLSDSTNTLKVHGNSGDHIAVQDDGWVDGGSHGFYHTFTHDDAVLLVGANVTVEFV